MPTKIMYLMDYYMNPRGGTEGQLFQLIQFLDRSRYYPSLTLLRASDYIERHGFVCDVKVLGITRLASIRSILKIVRFGLTLRGQNYRLVHCFFNDVSMIAPPILRVLGIHVLVSRRDMGSWYTPKSLAVLRLVGPFVDRYVANGQAVKQLVRQREWISDEKISVIYNGYVFSTENGNQTHVAARIPGVPDGAPIVGIVANLRPIKRIDTLVEAFVLASKQCSDAYLVIVGDKESKQAVDTLEELEVLARRLGVHHRVIFIGRVEDPMPYINRFTVAVLCSESEGFSNSLIEYMQARRPVVCTDTGGNSEVVQDGHNGFLVPVGDIGALADRLVRLLSDSSLAHRLGAVGYETVRTYTHTRMVTEQMACYDKIFSSDRTRWGLYRWLRRV